MARIRVTFADCESSRSSDVNWVPGHFEGEAIVMGRVRSLLQLLPPLAALVFCGGCGDSEQTNTVSNRPLPTDMLKNYRDEMSREQMKGMVKQRWEKESPSTAATPGRPGAGAGHGYAAGGGFEVALGPDNSLRTRMRDTLGGGLASPGPSGPANPLAGTGAEIHGSVLADLGDESLGVPLPGFEVRLTEAKGSTTTAVTDDFGRYNFRRQEPGTYRLTWEAPGWQSGEAAAPIVIGSKTRYSDPILVKPEVSDRTSTLHGSVQMADGSSPWFSDKLFGLTQRAAVHVLDGTGQLVGPGTTLANAGGDFVIPGLPRGKLTVLADLSRQWGDSAWDKVAGAKIASVEPTLDRPVVAWKPPIEIQTSRLMVPVSVTAENKPVLAVEPNKPVQCLAELKGEGAIQFRWQIPGYHPADNEKAVLNWKAPERQGLLTAYVLAYNDQGGVGIGRGTFAVAANTLFSAPPLQTRPGLRHPRFQHPQISLS